MPCACRSAPAGLTVPIVQPELGEVLAPAWAKLGTVRVVEVLQDAVEQVLGRHGSLALAFGVAGSEPQGALGEQRRTTQRGAAPAAAAPPRPTAGPPHRSPDRLRAERCHQPGAHSLHLA